MNLELNNIFKSDKVEPRVKGNFIINCTVLYIEDGYEVLDYTVDEAHYDEEVRNLVMHELEYDKYPDLGMTAGDTGEFKLKVESQYTKDYYGEVDLDIQVEVL